MAITLCYFSNEKSKRIGSLEVYVDSCLVFFLTNQKYRCPRPRTGHFRGLVGFEAKAKDLSFKARARTSKCVLEARSQQRF